MTTETMKELEHCPDAEIISKILEGDVQLYEMLIRRHNALLYKIGRSYGYSHSDTEDLMQESYISAYCNLQRFEHRSSFKTWLSRIMINYCFKKNKKLSYKNEIASEHFYTDKPEFMSYGYPNNEKSILNRELGRVIENALLQLPGEYRMVFTLRELNGLSVAETSATLNISESNVKVRLNRAKTMLRSRIEKMYSPAEIFEFNLVYCNSMVEKVMDCIHRLNATENLR